MAEQNSSAQDDSMQLTSADLLATKLVNNVFDGTNFGAWKRGMEISLSTKNKLGFINGSIEKPPISSPTVKTWQRCNDMVFSWILNSVSSEIANSILYSKTAREAWVDLNERFRQSNRAQLYGIHKKLVELSQGNDNVASYFTKLKMIWDELDSIDSTHKCSCNCSCGGKEKDNKSQQNQRAVQFLMGLNDSFRAVKGTILMQKPLPSVSTIYNILLQEEDQNEVKVESHFNQEATSFYARNSRGNSSSSFNSTQNKSDYRSSENRKPYLFDINWAEPR